MRGDRMARKTKDVQHSWDEVELIVEYIIYCYTVAYETEREYRI